MTGVVTLHGHAIVSADDRIADSDGAFPEPLRNDADWELFQAELDACDLVALGRASHDAAPNVRDRRRLVLSRSVAGLVERPDGWWWNPDRASWAAVKARLLPAGGRVGVPGGQVAFDFFAAVGFDTFHLSRIPGLRLPGGRGVFAAVEAGVPAAAILADRGLTPDAERVIDPAAGVTLTVWRRPAQAPSPFGIPRADSEG